MARTFCLRLDDETADLIDQAAAGRAMMRSDWMANVLERGLVGDGLMSTETATERRESRRTKPRARVVAGMRRER